MIDVSRTTQQVSSTLIPQSTAIQWCGVAEISRLYTSRHQPHAANLTAFHTWETAKPKPATETAAAHSCSTQHIML
jgi:hypothetical protein